MLSEFEKWENPSEDIPTKKKSKGGSIVERNPYNYKPKVI